jgi:ABC-type lipoprotein export system ATPase subunit/ABC-type antimicrobial peptide transport system permease subunit
MIKLNHLHKYYNRKKQNEIHVINDADIVLPDKGLVMLVGPSGSGKTTLLNVLGGLDKVQEGSIDFNHTRIEKYNTKTWDMIRNKEVGYIFQNYNLLKNLTVYENIELTLNMIGIYDEAEIDHRVDYILNAMGMINYRKRRASQLSGGQQQRVAIARALAKNPSVIIADEPTGNLDSKNTQDIMNIIKSISYTKLVVLVTHEEHLAAQYADRIIRLKDGRIISDVDHAATGASNIKHDTDIYLKDLTHVTSLKDDHVQLETYQDETIDDKLNVRLIAKNKTLYIDVQSDQYQKLNLIDQDSEVRIFDAHFKQEEKQSVDSDLFNLNNVIKKEKEDDLKHSVISIKDSIRLSMRKIKDASKIGKLFYLGFALGAVLIALAVGMLSGIYRVQPEEFVTQPVETVRFFKNELIHSDLLDIETHSSIGYIKYVDTVNINIEMPTVYQNYATSQSLSEQVVYSDFLNPDDIITGRQVNDYNEFILDESIAYRILQSSNLNYVGINTIEDLLSINYHAVINGMIYEMRLVGIADTDNPVIYLKEETAIMIETSVGVYDIFEDELENVTGTISDSNDILLDNSIPVENYPAYIGYNVAGTYDASESLPSEIFTLDQLKQVLYDQTMGSNRSLVHVFSNDVEATIAYLDSEGIDATSTYASDLQTYKTQRMDTMLPVLTFTLVVLGASAISYFFIIRSSLLSRIYEISVYRALGVSKGDIRKMFVTEIIFITSITSLIGYLVMSGILYRIQVLSENYMDLIYISPLSIIGGIGLIYLVNIISGLIPVTNLLRKTPAEILSKYDF